MSFDEFRERSAGTPQTPTKLDTVRDEIDDDGVMLRSFILAQYSVRLRTHRVHRTSIHSNYVICEHNSAAVKL